MVTVKLRICFVAELFVVDERDAADHLICADVFADAFEEAAGDPAVAFGPGERAFFFLFA